MKIIITIIGVIAIMFGISQISIDEVTVPIVSSLPIQSVLPIEVTLGGAGDWCASGNISITESCNLEVDKILNTAPKDIAIDTIWVLDKLTEKYPYPTLEAKLAEAKVAQKDDHWIGLVVDGDNQMTDRGKYTRGVTKTAAALHTLLMQDKQLAKSFLLPYFALKNQDKYVLTHQFLVLQTAKRKGLITSYTEDYLGDIYKEHTANSGISDLRYEQLWIILQWNYPVTQQDLDSYTAMLEESQPVEKQHESMFRLAVIKNIIN